MLADTEHLHRKIAEMGHRIRSLEDALAIFQSGVSNDAHPLLTEELLAVKYGLETPPREATGEHQAVPVDGLGTLTITDRGDSHYFGRTAGSEVNFSWRSLKVGILMTVWSCRRSFWWVLLVLGTPYSDALHK